MKISIDTKEDSNEELKNVIRMLQNLVGESGEVFTNQPSAISQDQSPIANIFGDAPGQAVPETPAQEAAEQTQSAQAETADQSTDDLFAELFSEEEIKKMEPAPKEEEDIPKTKGKKYSIELY